VILRDPTPLHEKVRRSLAASIGRSRHRKSPTVVRGLTHAIRVECLQRKLVRLVRKADFDRHINNPEVNQCEVTYVNHIEIEQGSKSYGSLRNVISCWSGQYSGDFLREPEAVGFNSRYLLQEKKGRLHISMQPAIRREDAKEILRLTLTARGKPASSEPSAIEEWFNIGHEWVVRGFTDVTTKEMHDIWGRTQ
jgi:hypothetical protein